MSRTIQYGVDTDGAPVAKCEGELAYFLLEYENMTPENNFTPKYHLEKTPASTLYGNNWFEGITWTRKIALRYKEQFRRFFGLKAIKIKPIVYGEYSRHAYKIFNDFQGVVGYTFHDVAPAKEVKRLCRLGTRSYAKEVGGSYAGIHRNADL